MKPGTLGLVVTLALGFLAAMVVFAPQKSKKVPVVSVLEPGPPPTVMPRTCLEALRRGLDELGYREGQNLVLEYRYAEFQPDRLSTLAAEVVQRQPDVIWTHSGSAARVLKQATTTIPIVVGVSADLEEHGLVESLARPGGNLTGLESRSFELTSKRLELLKEAVPQMTRVAILIDPTTQNSARIPSAFEREARALGIHLLRVEAGDPGAFDAAFTTMVEQRADALVLMDGPLFGQHARRLAELALAHRLPSIAAPPGYVQAGGLIAYGAYIPDLCRRSAVHVDKILKGARPATLPVERADKFDFIVNLKTAEALGLTLSPQFLFLANELIR